MTPSNTDNTKPTYYIDASAFKESLCMRRLFYVIVCGYRQKAPSPSLSYGSACHKYVATLREHNNHAKGIMDAMQYYMPYAAEWPDKEWRTVAHLMKTCAVYKEFYDNDAELKSCKYPIPGVGEKILIEQRFAVKIYECEYFNLVLCGTVDEIGLWDNHEMIVVDRKTSSAFYKVEETLKMYQQSSQMMFYKYIAEKLLGLKNLRVVIEGIFLSSQSNAKIVRTEPFVYEPWRMLQFEKLLEDTIKGLIDNLTRYHIHKEAFGEDIFDTGIFPMNFLACDSTRYDVDKIGACKFFNVCANSDKEIREFMIKKDLTTVEYNPLKFGEEKA